MEKMADLFGRYCYIDTPWIAGKKTRYRILGSGVQSNEWCEVPVTGRTELIHHDKMEDVVFVVLDTLVSDDSIIQRFALKDVDVMPADVRPVVRCRDCKFWHDAYILQSDGTKRMYRENDFCSPGIIKNCVTMDIGINCGAKCHVEDGIGWGTNKRVFRQADDFCSRGELRPCSYDEWWGIVDGVYPEEDKS